MLYAGPSAFTPAASIDPTAMEQFLAHGERRTIPRKHLIIRKGDPAESLYYGMSGLFRHASGTGMRHQNQSQQAIDFIRKMKIIFFVFRPLTIQG